MVEQGMPLQDAVAFVRKGESRVTRHASRVTPHPSHQNTKAKRMVAAAAAAASAAESAAAYRIGS